MTKKNITIWILAVVSTVSTTALITLWLIRPAVPDFRGYHQNHFKSQQHERMEKDRLIKKLNLRPEQENKFFDSRAAHKQRIMPIFENIGQLREIIFTELEKDNSDTVLINDAIEKISVYEANLQKESVNYMLSMKEFLDPVQVDSMLVFFSKAMMPMGRCEHDSTHHKCRQNLNTK
ncbi:MAG: hypothetical protein CVU11_05005 [Bacteroidetes bacterium HGW-Bacteroidetes-6]|jgi:Spy/CpxP family protein refolding chaperone|nr:MAG: hypothetical protein CVU11_05005 [Bacteroidetes bacterium HGW-Bacteroidetes-6]